MSGLHQSVHLALEAHPRLAERSAGGLSACSHRQRGRWLKSYTLYDDVVTFRPYCPFDDESSGRYCPPQVLGRLGEREHLEPLES